MTSVTRFDLLNFWLCEPIDVNPINVAAFPAVKRLILIPQDTQVPAYTPPGEKPGVAFVELDGTGNELHETAESFMEWVCWLLSLAELRHVHYWGSYFYERRPTDAWQRRSSSWALTIVKGEMPTVLGGRRIHEGTATYWQIPRFISKGLAKFSDPNFATSDFLLTLHLFLDSLPHGQLGEFRFVKKWIPFEKLVNEHSEADGSIYVFGKKDSQEFSSLREKLAIMIKEDPIVATHAGAAEALLRQLSALERAPIKILAGKFLNRWGVPHDQEDIDDMVRMRNRIFHYAETSATAKNVRELSDQLDKILKVVLCRYLEWDCQRELEERYSRPWNEPLPAYVNLTPNLENEFAAEGLGIMEAEDGSLSAECHGTVRWNRERIEATLRATERDRWNVPGLFGKNKHVKLSLATDDGILYLHGAKVMHIEMPAGRFKIVAVRVRHQKVDEA